MNITTVIYTYPNFDKENPQLAPTGNDLNLVFDTFSRLLFPFSNTSDDVFM
jgi:hypothetical protein